MPIRSIASPCRPGSQNGNAMAPRVCMINRVVADRAAIPGGRPNPVTTLISPLAFRKHGCDNMPLKETIERLDDLMSGGCNVHRGTERTQASVCRCPLPFGSKQLCQHHGC